MNCPLWALGQFQRQVKPQHGDELTKRQPDQLPRHACRQYVRDSDQKCLIQLNPSGIVLTDALSVRSPVLIFQPIFEGRQAQIYFALLNAVACPQ